ncbi:hypothetical protein [Comamonas sp.]|uniref:hypothetical protein n=1 Tax=Comamonas sp. TaxID=34028 RepID=UPI0028B0F5B7|nr:hypothetical protein [Comamonas sp.]
MSSALLNVAVRWVAIALAVLATIACLKLVQKDAEISELKMTAANELADRQAAARVFEAKLGRQERAHAAAQQEKDESYASESRKLQTQLAAERGTTGRLRKQLENATAGANSGSSADPVACQRAFDRLETLGRLAGEGVELLAEGRGILRQRDRDVQRVLDQVKIDRAGCGQTQ